MNKEKRKNGEDEEVEELLKAAQDELLLKMSVDSHLSRVSLDPLPSDLDRRFQALKTGLGRPQKCPPPSLSDDHLFSRFAALKASSSSVSTIQQPIPDHHHYHHHHDDDDEVEKIIQWAKDAVRLDPSPPSSSDDVTVD